MKILITGANGMLGSDISPLLIKEDHQVHGGDIRNVDNDLRYLDICDTDNVKSVVSDVKPDMVFHLAAETDVDKCELEPEHAYRINVAGTKNIAMACKECGCILVYTSTCGVFDEKRKGPFTELDKPNPVNVYSKTKLEGEKVVKDLIKKHFIFRIGWMMGGNEKDKKFVAKMVKLIRTKNEISVINDKFGSPTYTRDLSKGMIEVVKTGRFGLYHMANAGSCSRYELALKIREYLGKKDVVVKPVSSSQYPLPAPRPRSEAVVDLNLQKIGLDGIMRPWEEALKEYLDQLDPGRI